MMRTEINKNNKVVVDRFYRNKKEFILVLDTNGLPVLEFYRAHGRNCTLINGYFLDTCSAADVKRYIEQDLEAWL